MLRILLLSLALLIPSLSVAQQGDPVTEFSTEDDRMNAAMEQAKTTLPVFLANVTDGEGNSLPNTSLKVAFPTPSGAEIIWVSPFLWDGGVNMAGILANQPNFMGDLNAGDVVLARAGCHFFKRSFTTRKLSGQHAEGQHGKSVGVPAVSFAGDVALWVTQLLWWRVE